MEWTMEAMQPLLASAGYAVLIMIVILAFGAVGAIIWFRLREHKRYGKYSVFIWRTIKDEHDNEMPVFAGWDKGAIIKDETTKSWVFHVKEANVDMGMEETDALDEVRDLDVPTMPGDDGKQIVFMKKLGPRKYAMGKPHTFEGKVKVIVSAADMQEAQRSYDINARLAGTDKKWWVAPAVLIITIVMICVMFMTLFNKLEFLADMAASFEAASQSFRSCGQAAVQSAAPT